MLRIVPLGDERSGGGKNKVNLKKNVICTIRNLQ